jgi:hypothetical protein
MRSLCVQENSIKKIINLIAIRQQKVVGGLREYAKV